MGQCFGLARNLNRCGRIGDWTVFCNEHHKQWISWVIFIVFTVGSGTLSIISFFDDDTPELEDSNIAIEISKCKHTSIDIYRRYRLNASPQDCRSNSNVANFESHGIAGQMNKDMRLIRWNILDSQDNIVANCKCYQPVE